ncbi:hypothetical protein HPO96_31200 [Kribbella sandramycini]|uniref:Uncharacterized protein n=1 Tax=Kribbella sandramycini TaxID=60450 RepID=A0A7Y4L7G7_9ACTN|nr:hypothetical protein [Kribbella sandramycini]MBB6567004.1 hypothetical protein [Kribbella sandramycini]NOL44726.1 hypothetical protein [Kribbella sandramycini]
MDDREDWRGALDGVRRHEATEVLMAPIRRTESGAAAFLGLAESQRQYWIKPLGNPQGDQILVTEQLVSAAGRLIGAPVRPTALIEIPEELSGWKYGEVHRLSAGIAHGSLNLEFADVIDELLYTSDDDNARRQPALAALWDWCLGEDEQWLYDLRDDHSIWTFDHGLWLGGGFGWSGDQLAHDVAANWWWTEPVTGMDKAAFGDVADRIEAVTAEQLIEVVAGVPVAWDVPPFELETVAWFLYRRRTPVANRLRAAGRAG